MCAYSLESDIDTYPDDWNPTKIGEIAEVRGGYSFPVNYQGNIQGDIPFYKVSDMNLRGNETRMSTANNYVTLEMLAHLNGKTFPENTIIFPKVGGAVYTNKKRILTSNSLVDNNIMGVVVSETNRCYSEFLYYWFVNTDLKNFSNPGPLPSITATAIKNAFVPLPPIHEQRAIAHVLTTVRQSIEATERVIAATCELKRSLMKHFFTNGPIPIDQVDQIELEENNLGNYPRAWKLTKLEEIAYINEHSRDPREDPDSTFAYIDISSVDSSIGQITSPTYLKGREAPSRARRVIHTGDIILSTVRPNLKAFSIVPNEFDNQICSTGFAVLTAKESCCSEFLFYAALSDIVSKQFVQRMKGANYPAINSGDVKETVIPLPPLDQQIIIAKHLGAIDKKIKKEILRKKALASLFESLLHNLVTGKVRVPSVEM